MKLDKRQYKLYAKGCRYKWKEFRDGEGYWVTVHEDYHGRKPLEFWFFPFSVSFLLAEGIEFDDDLYQ